MTMTKYLDPARGTRRWITLGLALGGAVAGAGVGLVLTILGKIVAGAPPADTANYLWNAEVFAVMGAAIAPLATWSALRAVPFWRTIAEPLGGSILGAGLGVLLGSGLAFLLLVPLGGLAAVARLHFAYRARALPRPKREAMIGMLAAVMLVSLSACVLPPPQPPPPRPATVVHANFDKTWNAVIDYFADRHDPIRNMERASGFIATGSMNVGLSDAQAWADCGRGPFAVPAEYGEFAVVVRPQGDTASTVRFTPQWTGHSGAPCVTKGAWEADAEQAIATTAEGHAPAVTGTPSSSVPKVSYTYVHTLRPTWIMDSPNGSRTVLRLQEGTTLVVLGARSEVWVNVAAGAYRGYVAAKDIEDQH
jgi:hypothetical protein